MQAALVTLLLAAPPPAVRAQIDAIKKELRVENHEKAIEIGEKLVAAEPSCSACYTWLGRSYGGKALKASIFTRLGLAKKCRTSFEKAVALDATSMEALFDLLGYYRDVPAFAGGNLEKAREMVPVIAAARPARGHVARASILEKQGEVAAAEAEYRKAVEADPKDAAAVGRLAGFLNRQKRPAEAVELCRKAAAAAPEEPLFRYQLGRMVAATGLEVEAGLKALDEYLAAPSREEEAPDAADARWRRGEILQKAGRPAEARGEYEAALALEPDHPGARHDLEALRKP